MIRLMIALFGSLFLAGTNEDADRVPSGPPAGRQLPGPFSCVDVKSGRKTDYDEVFPRNEHVVLAFVRSENVGTVNLLKSLDQLTLAKPKEKEPPLRNAAVVFLDDQSNPQLETRLKELAELLDLKNLRLFVYSNPRGPEGYNLADDAEATIILYRKGRIELNHAYKKSGLTDETLKAVQADIEKFVKDDK